MVTLYFLDGKPRLRNVCWLAQVTRPSPPMLTHLPQKRQVLSHLLLRQSPIVCAFNVCKFYYERGRGTEDRKRGECNSCGWCHPPLHSAKVRPLQVGRYWPAVHLVFLSSRESFWELSPHHIGWVVSVHRCVFLKIAWPLNANQLLYFHLGLKCPRNRLPVHTEQTQLTRPYREVECHSAACKFPIGFVGDFLITTKTLIVMS